jgi:hypothetical protein
MLWRTNHACCSPLLCCGAGKAWRGSHRRECQGGAGGGGGARRVARGVAVVVQTAVRWTMPRVAGAARGPCCSEPRMLTLRTPIRSIPAQKAAQHMVHHGAVVRRVCAMLCPGRLRRLRCAVLQPVVPCCNRLCCVATGCAPCCVQVVCDAHAVHGGPSPLLLVVALVVVRQPERLDVILRLHIRAPFRAAVTAQSPGADVGTVSQSRRRCGATVRLRRYK